MLPIKINLPEGFLEEEIRKDYLVSSKMKKVWAVQLDLLIELDRVCKKHGLMYFADSGTLIGSVRDKGYIPWDDDIDIVMMRQDYDKLIRECCHDFEAPYFLQTAYTDKILRGFARLRNSQTTAITRFDSWTTCNKGIFIDIFPLDNFPYDDPDNVLWVKKIRALFKIMQVGVNHQPKDYPTAPKKICCFALNAFFKIVDYRDVFNYYEKTCKKYLNHDTRNVSYIAYSRGKKKHIWKRSCFASSQPGDFEFVQIPIPSGFDSRLQVEYGDYMQPKKAPTVHGDTIFEPEIAYTEFEKQYSREEIQKQLLELSNK